MVGIGVGGAVDRFRGQRLAEAVGELVGEECWGVAAGEGTGTRFTLDLGAKFRLDRPIPNELLAPDVREYEAAYVLFVEGCPWRVQTATEVVGSWDDDNANDGPMVAALERLIGARVVAAEVEPPAWDLTVSFDHGLRLVVFADGTPRTEYDDYSFATPDVTYIVGKGGRVEAEDRILDQDA